MKNPLLAAACGVAIALASTMADAQIVVRVGPPAPRFERHGPPPRPGWEWHRGYHRWDGSRYVWTPGAYVEPHPGHRWVDGHWDRRGRGYVWVDGYWR